MDCSDWVDHHIDEMDYYCQEKGIKRSQYLENISEDARKEWDRIIDDLKPLR